MDLYAASRRFDDTVLTDGYTGTDAGKAQLKHFSDAVRDSVTVNRRILSAAPNLAIPSRRVIAAAGETWIVGKGANDVFGGQIMRTEYVVQEAEALATIHSIASALALAAGTSAYASRTWVKAGREIDESSDTNSQFALVFASTETLAQTNLVLVGSVWYMIRTMYPSAAGFVLAVADELVNPTFETVTLGTRTYNPVTDTFTSTTTSARLLRVRWQSHFEYLSQASQAYQPGDEVGMVLSTLPTAPKASDQITLSDGVFRVLAAINEGTYLSLHLRRI